MCPAPTRRPAPFGPAPSRPPATPRHPWLTRALAAYLVLRAALITASVLTLFVVLTAIAGAWIEAAWARATIGAAGALLLPVLLRSRLRRALGRRTGLRPSLGGPWFLLACNVTLLLAICLGFSDAVGRSLRRRGDWFLGELDGPLPRRYRLLLGAASAGLERFDLPPEARLLLAEAATPVVAPTAPLPGGTPLPPPAAPWLHPLLGPARATPPNAACRFGAPRPGPRPGECELGHCGIDLVQPEGSSVHAVHEGRVQRVQRDAAAGGIAGRFVILAHRDGTVQSYYVHLQEIRTDLRPGTPVRAGEIIGTLGRTGVLRSGPHLHFALAIQRGSGQLYVDPEPLIRRWELPAQPRPLLASSSSSGAAQ